MSGIFTSRLGDKRANETWLEFRKGSETNTTLGAMQIFEIKKSQSLNQIFKFFENRFYTTIPIV